MATRNLFGRLGDKVPGGFLTDMADTPEGAPLGGTRTEALQRLQIGLTGLCTMILLIGIASVLGTQANRAEEAAVPDAAPTTEPSASPAQRDPLADAGVVPDLPAEAEAEGKTGSGPKVGNPQGQSNSAADRDAVRVPDTQPVRPNDAEGRSTRRRPPPNDR